MGDLWTDLQLALVIIFFIYLLKWSTDFTGSKKIGIILAAIVAYLTFFQHTEFVWIILVLFFGFSFFGQIAEGFTPPAK